MNLPLEKLLRIHNITPENIPIVGSLICAAHAYTELDDAYREVMKHEPCQARKTALVYWNADPNGEVTEELLSCWQYARNEIKKYPTWYDPSTDTVKQEPEPDHTWCPACRRNWERKRRKTTVVNQRTGALRRIKNCVKRLEAKR
jgi:hypothetical protein